jgi:hypothetical protein
MEENAIGASPPAKKPRLFIARQACEHCRLKKTRCDETRPACGHCTAAGIECNYGERKATKYGLFFQHISELMLKHQERGLARHDPTQAGTS